MRNWFYFSPIALQIGQPYGPTVQFSYETRTVRKAIAHRGWLRGRQHPPLWYFKLRNIPNRTEAWVEPYKTRVSIGIDEPFCDLPVQRRTSAKDTSRLWHHIVEPQCFTSAICHNCPGFRQDQRTRSDVPFPAWSER